MSQEQGGQTGGAGAPERVFGVQPRPRILVIGFTDEPDIVEGLRRLAPTVQEADHPSDVNQHEFDLLVTDRFQSPWPHPTFRSRPVVAGHLSVLHRSTGAQRRFDRVSELGDFVVAGELIRPPGLASAVARLVEHVLAPAMEVTHTQGRRHRPFVSSRPVAERYPAVLQGPGAGPELHPFLHTGQGAVLAGWYERSERSECWFLPQEVTDVVPWVEALLDHLHGRDPDRYPAPPDWTVRRKWQTPVELGLLDEITAVEQERTEVLERLDARERDLRAALGDARTAADGYERGLLTAQGDELVALVIRALRELGFEVIDRDAILEPGEQRLEDLEVGDPAVPGWTALTEVKGYARGGAKAGDLTQIERFVSRFKLAHGRRPSATWYLVDDFAGTDPALRPPVLSGADGDVAGFAQVGGLVWSTAQLFTLLVAVRSERATADEVRALLRDRTGRLLVPHEWEHDDVPSPDVPPPAGSTE